MLARIVRVPQVDVGNLRAIDHFKTADAARRYVPGAGVARWDVDVVEQLSIGFRYMFYGIEHSRRQPVFLLNGNVVASDGSVAPEFATSGAFAEFWIGAAVVHGQR